MKSNKRQSKQVLDGLQEREYWKNFMIISTCIKGFRH